MTPRITEIELLGNFQQQLVEALEPTQAASFLQQEGQEAAPFFGAGAIAIHCEMKRVVDEVSEDGESASAGKSRPGLLRKTMNERMLFPARER